MTNGHRTAAGLVLPEAGSGLTPEDISDRQSALAETFGGPLFGHVVVADGYGVSLTVERGHLTIKDGVGEHRRERRSPKVNPPRRLAVGIGSAGFLTFETLRWCASVGTTVVVLGKDGAILVADPPGRDDARLLRAQCLALGLPVGLEIARYLIAEKLRGQAKVATGQLAADETASRLLALAEEARAAETIGDVRDIEAEGANHYFATWEAVVEVAFARRDVPLIPAHWLRFSGRKGLKDGRGGRPRNAADPVNALLNYSYKLAEIEAGLAARRLGLAESVGILHADQQAGKGRGRPSLACDLQEVVRPLVDASVLELCRGPRRKREFCEDGRGAVSVMAPLTHQLAQTMPAYAETLAPVAERVASMLLIPPPTTSTCRPCSVGPVIIRQRNGRWLPLVEDLPKVAPGARHAARKRRRERPGRHLCARSAGPRFPWCLGSGSGAGATIVWRALLWRRSGQRHARRSTPKSEPGRMRSTPGSLTRRNTRIRYDKPEIGSTPSYARR